MGRVGAEVGGVDAKFAMAGRAMIEWRASLRRFIAETTRRRQQQWRCVFPVHPGDSVSNPSFVKPDNPSAEDPQWARWSVFR